MTNQEHRFAEEKFADQDYDEVYPLLVKHWEEVAANKTKVPLNPDFHRYLELEQQNCLHILTCRDQDNRLIGYISTFITPHIHYMDTVYADNDLIYIHPDHRKGTLALRMLKHFEIIMKERGVSVLHMHVKTYKDFSPLLERIGYSHIENIYSKYIGD